MIVKRVVPLSAAKVMGVLYALLGLLLGALISVISIVGGAIGAGDEGSPFVGMLFGAGAIVILPIFYGVMGFIGTLIAAALYNFVASLIGGVELELQQGPGPS